MMVTNHRKIFLTISVLIIVTAMVAVGVFGLRLGIDFTGGTLTEVTYPDGRPGASVMEERLNTLGLGGYSLRLSGEDGFILRTRDLSEGDRQAVLNALSLDGATRLTGERYTSIGPTIGTELRRKALEAIAIVIITTILYVAFAFRKVSEPVSSWKYGLIAIATLLHDIAVPTGVFAILGRFAGFEVDTLFVTALLVILGYSVNDTIVIFDRIRENLRHAHETHSRESFEEIVGRSLRETYARSINTSLTVFLVLLSLFFLGGPTIHAFILALLIGVVAGSYSSLFFAPPLLVAWDRQKRV